MEITPPDVLSESLSSEVQQALPLFVDYAMMVMKEWRIGAYPPESISGM